MTDKPTTDRKIGALDSCLIVNRVISFLCDRYEDIVGLADQYRTGIAGTQHIGEILHRNTQAFDGGQHAFAFRQTARICVGLNR